LLWSSNKVKFNSDKHKDAQCNYSTLRLVATGADF